MRVHITEPAPVREVAQPSPSASLRWPVAICTASALVLFAPVLYKLVHDWWALPDFSHGFLVPLFSAYVVWRQRKDLAQIPIRGSWGGLALLLLAMLMFVAGQLGAELFVSRVAILVTVAAAIVMIAGSRMLRALMFPLLFLLLMIPIPALIFNQITFPLQLLASRLASMLLPLLNVPVLREGNVINIPAMPLEVAEACSGIRSLMTLATLAIMYSYLADDVHWRRVVLVLASVPIAVIANATRVVGTGVCVQYWDPDKALGFFHEFSGLAVFMLALAMLYVSHVGLRVFGRKGA